MGFFDQLKQGLDKTRKNFTTKIEQLVTGVAAIDEEFLDELEAILISADVGVKTAGMLIYMVRQGIKDQQINDPSDLKPFLRRTLSTFLGANLVPLTLAVEPPTVIMVIGVNGAGKTTTIGKLAHYYRQQDKKVLLAAADTFRAAAVEQLEIWSDRSHADIVKHVEGSDPSAVVYDAVQAAKARKTDIVIIDTAGRLHTKSNLMEELKKMCRVVSREVPGAPHEMLLVLDATTGQNAINQAKIFGEAAGVTGVVLTKLDGTAKGGVVIAVKTELGIPVKWIGIGEGINDLRPFDPEAFVEALFSDK
jgi:fused signal recognition particle receptor